MRLGQFRRGTLAEWTSINPILADGEFVVISTDPSQPKNYDKWKCGNGINYFNDLPMRGIDIIVQELGNSVTEVMSQKAVTDSILSAITTVPLVIKADGAILQYKVVTPSGVQGSSDTPYFKLYNSSSNYMPSGITSAALIDKEVTYQKVVKMGLIRNISTEPGSIAENWTNGQIIYIQSDGSLSPSPITAWIGGAFFKDIDINVKKGSLYVRIEYNHNLKVDKTSLSGIFANKPILPEVGVAYFCTDKQTIEGSSNGIIIYHKGDNIWTDALGRIIS